MFNISCIQLTSDNNVFSNLEKTTDLIINSIKKKADLIITPENTSLFTLDHSELLEKAEHMNNNFFLESISRISKSYKKWILIGSLPIKLSRKLLANRSVLFNPNGKIANYYDKIHMFDVKLSNKEKYEESKKFEAGKKKVIAKLPWGLLGFSICYDVRFPNLYRELAKKGAIFITVPSAFTKTTGEKHWHTLLKARAIENFSYIFAAAQTGKHYNDRLTYGHSLIISPDGEILKEKEKGEGFIIARIDENLPNKLRAKIPSLKSN
jgi:predicted amidohydrolase